MVNTISRDCLLARPVYLSETTIAALTELKKQLRAMGAYDAEKAVDRDIDAIGDNNEVLEKRCPPPEK